jgi:hypothetical protein
MISILAQIQGSNFGKEMSSDIESLIHENDNLNIDKPIMEYFGIDINNPTAKDIFPLVKSIVTTEQYTKLSNDKTESNFINSIQQKKRDNFTIEINKGINNDNMFLGILKNVEIESKGTCLYISESKKELISGKKKIGADKKIGNALIFGKGIDLTITIKDKHIAVILSKEKFKINTNEPLTTISLYEKKISDIKGSQIENIKEKYKEFSTSHEFLDNLDKEIHKTTNNTIIDHLRKIIDSPYETITKIINNEKLIEEEEQIEKPEDITKTNSQSVIEQIENKANSQHVIEEIEYITKTDRHVIEQIENNETVPIKTTKEIIQEINNQNIETLLTPPLFIDSLNIQPKNTKSVNDQLEDINKIKSKINDIMSENNFINNIIPQKINLKSLPKCDHIDYENRTHTQHHYFEDSIYNPINNNRHDIDLQLYHIDSPNHFNKVFNETSQLHYDHHDMLPIQYDTYSKQEEYDTIAKQIKIETVSINNTTTYTFYYCNDKLEQREKNNMIFLLTSKDVLGYFLKNNNYPQIKSAYEYKTECNFQNLDSIKDIYGPITTYKQIDITLSQFKFQKIEDDFKKYREENIVFQEKVLYDYNQLKTNLINEQNLFVQKVTNQYNYILSRLQYLESQRTYEDNYNIPTTKTKKIGINHNINKRFNIPYISDLENNNPSKLNTNEPTKYKKRGRPVGSLNKPKYDNTNNKVSQINYRDMEGFNIRKDLVNK